MWCVTVHETVAGYESRDASSLAQRVADYGIAGVPGATWVRITGTTNRPKGAVMGGRAYKWWGSRTGWNVYEHLNPPALGNSSEGAEITLRERSQLPRTKTQTIRGRAGLGCTLMVMREMESKLSSTADNSCVGFEARLKKKVREVRACRERERGGTRAEKGWGERHIPRRPNAREMERCGSKLSVRRTHPSPIKQFLHKSGVPTNSSH